MSGQEQRWRYTFCDLTTRRALARLPLVDADLAEVISGPAKGSGSVPLSSAAVRRADPWTATRQRRTICFAERVAYLEDGTEVAARTLWAGIVWKRVRSGRSLALDMATPESYLARRRVAVARTWTGGDDATILRTLVNDAQAVPGGSIGIDVPASYSGTTSDHTSEPSDEQTLLEEVQAVAEAAPLEWRIVPGGNAVTGFTLTLVISPRIGGETGNQLVWTSSPGNRAGNEVIGYEVTEDGSEVPNALHGATEDAAGNPLVSVATSSEIDAGFPLLEATVTTDTEGVTTQGRLDRLTAAELTRRRQDETQLTSLTVAGSRGPDLADYTLGDTLSVRALDMLWPVPTTFSGRLLGRRILPAQPGRAEVVAMTLGGT